MCTARRDKLPMDTQTDAWTVPQARSNAKIILIFIRRGSQPSMSIPILYSIDESLELNRRPRPLVTFAASPKPDGRVFATLAVLARLTRVQSAQLTPPRLP
jgi:hypothetical protein